MSTDETKSGDSFLDRLVASKGEQFKDPEVLAKSKLAADDHIANLEKQIEDLKREQGLESYRSEVASKVAKPTAPEAAATTQPAGQVEVKADTQADTPAATQGSADVSALVAAEVARALSEKNAETSQKANVESVIEALRAKFGDRSSEALQTRMAEHGLDETTMTNLMATSPKAALTLLGLNGSKPTPIVPKGDVRPGASATPATTEADYFKPKSARARVADALRAAGL